MANRLRRFVSDGTVTSGISAACWTCLLDFMAHRMRTSCIAQRVRTSAWSLNGETHRSPSAAVSYDPCFGNGVIGSRMSESKRNMVRLSIEVVGGTIQVEVDPGAAPITAANFLSYVDL